MLIKELTPETVKIRQFIANLTKNQRIKYMIDLHGHGKKYSCFDADSIHSSFHAKITKKKMHDSFP
jgi:hypothetical protein